MEQRPDNTSPAYRQFIFGYRLVQHNEDQLADKVFDEFISKYPNDPWLHDAYFYRALALHRSHKSAKAQAYVSKIRDTAIVPKYAVDLLRAQLHIHTNRYTEAVRLLKNIQEQKVPKKLRPVIAYQRGLAYSGTNNLKAAAKYFGQSAGTRSAIQGQSLLDLARIQVALNQPDEALSTLTKCIKLGDPEYRHIANLNSGSICYQQKWFDKALTYYKRVITKQSNTTYRSAAILGLQMSFLGKHEYKELIANFRRYRSTLPKSDLLVASLLTAVAHQHLDEHDQAIGLLQGILPKSYNLEIHDRVLLRLAISWYQKAEPIRTLDIVSELIDQHPQSKLLNHAHFLKALTYVDTGDFKTAISLLGNIIQSGDRHPYYANALLHRGVAYQQTQEFTQAANDYRAYLDHTGFNQLGRRRGNPNALKITPQSRQAFVGLLDCYHRLKQYTQVTSLSGKWIRQAKLAPMTMQQALYRRSLALIKVGRRDDALETLNQLITQYPQNQFQNQGTYYRGLLRLSLDDPKGGIADLNESLDTKSARPLPSELAHNALSLIANHYRLANNNDLAARTLIKLNDLTNANDLDESDRLWLSKHFYDQDKPKSSLKFLKPLLSPASDTKPNVKARALLLAGQCLSSLDDYEKAAAVIKQAITLDASVKLDAHLALGDTYYQAGDLDQALLTLEPAAQAEDQMLAAQALFLRGNIYRQIFNTQLSAKLAAQAQQTLLQATMQLKRVALMLESESVFPLAELSFIELAEIYIESGDEPRAKLELEELLHRLPETSPYAEYAMAMIATLEGRTGDALVWLHNLQDQDIDPRLSKKVNHSLNRWQLGHGGDMGEP